jgi:hypothetical protein
MAATSKTKPHRQQPITRPLCVRLLAIGWIEPLVAHSESQPWLGKPQVSRETWKGGIRRR